MTKDWITTKEAAARLGVSDRRVRQMIGEGKLQADKVGQGRRGQWLVKASALDKIKAAP